MLEMVLDSSDRRKVASTDFKGIGLPRCLTWLRDEYIIRNDDDCEDLINVESRMSVLALYDIRDDDCGGFYEFFRDTRAMINGYDVPPESWNSDTYEVPKGHILWWLAALYVDILNQKHRAGGTRPWLDYMGRMDKIKEWLEMVVIWPSTGEQKMHGSYRAQTIANQARWRDHRWEELERTGQLRWQWSLRV